MHSLNTVGKATKKTTKSKLNANISDEIEQKRNAFVCKVCLM
jgi:hypothetical protein